MNISNYNHPKSCPVCLTGEKFTFIKSYNLKENNFALYQCQKCKIQFYLPFEGISEENYQKMGIYKISELIRPQIRRGYHKKFLKRNKIFIKETKVLDLGCGTGEFLNELEKRGCEVWGVDFDKNAIALAEKNFDFKNIYNSSFEVFFQKINLPKFDIVTSFQVLQYLDNPLEFIKNIKKILKPNGKIVLSVQSRKRVIADFNNWEFPPVTLTKWDEEAVANFFSEINFRISHVSYVEEFKTIVEALNDKIRFNLVSKTIDISKKIQDKSFFLPQSVYFLGRLKAYVVAFLPAFILWLWGKITKKENGVIFIELENAHD
ncbi:MAG: class I SAM-dependent methyltransferase [Candidatus Staskawiczbacteria bacterium]|jgi:SAM-dependent methyltransferase